MSEFDRFARSYDGDLQRGLALSGEDKSYFSRGRVAWLQRRRRELALPVPAHIADFGCGNGESLPHLLTLPGARSVLGLEISRALLHEAQTTLANTPGIALRHLSEHRPAGDLDLVYSNGVFHHIPPAERPASLQLIFDSLRAGGVFALWENSRWHPATRWVMSRIPFDRDTVPLSAGEARELARQAGFEILDTSYLFIFPAPLKALRVAEPALAKLPLGTQYQVLCRKPQ